MKNTTTIIATTNKNNNDLYRCVQNQKHIYLFSLLSLYLICFRNIIPTYQIGFGVVLDLLVINVLDCDILKSEFEPMSLSD